VKCMNSIHSLDKYPIVLNSVKEESEKMSSLLFACNEILWF
jgi:hypothetical protein